MGVCAGQAEEPQEKGGDGLGGGAEACMKWKGRERKGKDGEEYI